MTAAPLVLSHLSLEFCCVVLHSALHCPACSDPSIPVKRSQVQFVLLCELAPLLIYLVILICSDSSDLLSGLIYASNSPVQPSAVCSRLVLRLSL